MLSERAKRRVYRDQRPDGRYEIWLGDRPANALYLTRVESALVYAVLWLRRR